MPHLVVVRRCYAKCSSGKVNACLDLKSACRLLSLSGLELHHLYGCICCILICSVYAKYEQVVVCCLSKATHLVVLQLSMLGMLSHILNECFVLALGILKHLSVDLSNKLSICWILLNSICAVDHCEILGLEVRRSHVDNCRSTCYVGYRNFKRKLSRSWRRRLWLLFRSLLARHDSDCGYHQRSQHHVKSSHRFYLY